MTDLPAQSTQQALSRQADLHYAFQFGQDFAREGNSAVKQEFYATFADDAEAAQQFERGVRDVRSPAPQVSAAGGAAVFENSADRH